MNTDKHINVGLLALARGFITPQGFADCVRAISRAKTASVEDIWVRQGGLTAEQLGLLLRSLGEVPKPTVAAASSADTALFALSAAAGVATPPAAEAPAIGERYRRVALLGAGGLGEVLSCEDGVLGRTVALKTSHADGEIDAQSAHTILTREARIISSLEHPNIIPIYDAGRDPERGPYYVMRQVTDVSLETIMRRRKLGQGDARDWSLPRLLRYFVQICNAIEYAHSRGVLHCDLKPANILLGEFGDVLVVDWGLAQSQRDPLWLRGGTFGYMAPEQRDPNVPRLDIRVDVFSLGSILYELLCGERAFPTASGEEPGTTLGGRPNVMYEPPVPPSQRAAAGTEVPPELEEVCLRALALQAAERIGTVRELADAIEEYLEGTKERERRRVEADHSADAGDELAERYHEFVATRPETLALLATLRAQVAPWAPIEDKHELWDVEDMMRVTDALRVRTLQSAVSAYEHALDRVHNHARARQGLARLYWSELQRARRERHNLDEVAYEQLLRQHDDGTFVQQLQREGTCEITVRGHVSRLTLAPYEEQHRRLIEGDVEDVTERPVARRALPAGRYLLAAEVASGQRVCWPLLIEPGAVVQLEVDSRVAAGLQPGEVVVPGGTALLGGDPSSEIDAEFFATDVPTFIIQKFPVTFTAWFRFVEDLYRRDRATAELHLPSTSLGVPFWRYDGSRWLPDQSVAGVVEVDPEHLPVIGVTAESARAYAAWLATREQRSWRLPNELEWEKAARGTDGRAYPWGDHFDATFCKMREARPGLPKVEPIGIFPVDVSPYGVRDMAGGVADWCEQDPRRAGGDPGAVVSRGGAWYDWAVDCRLAARRRYLAAERALRVGVRLVRDP